ncbi:MAG: NAD-dependent epimerase [Proteobacteria bacterium]|nr:NAD-dependent epimerase [Pseudomonadota bacterium]
MRVLVTGIAGFIGFHVASALMRRGDDVIGLDNLSPYYDVTLKQARLAVLEKEAGSLKFEPVDILDDVALASFCRETKPEAIIHLAAQAGVRYSIEQPKDVININVVGFTNILEQAKQLGVSHLVYASSSSVYGSNRKTPFSVDDNVDHPISMYAASKKANELMAHTYSHLFGLPTTGLRFFTVYGPWGRPDMSAFLFTRAIFEGTTIKLFNHGQHQRDFTYIDDIVGGVIRVLDGPPKASEESAPYRVYNIGNNRPVELMYYVELIEQAVGKKAKTELLPMQPGDVQATYADIDALIRDHGYRPDTPIEKGIARFVEWYRDYYQS